MRLLTHLLGAAALCVSTTLASLATFIPTDGIKYSVGIPSSTTSAGSGDIFFQITAPDSYTWVAIGIGEQMDGSTIFVMYADGTGNVTISPRLGAPHVMPQFNPAAKVTVLAGSGVAGGVMTANVKYSVASDLLSLSSTAAGWIGSWKGGPALNSKDQSAIIYQHDDTSVYTLNLAKAVLADDSNPFVTSTTPGSGTGTSGPGASQTSDSSSGDDDNSGSSVVVTPLQTYEQAHGIIMGASMVVILPLGAIILRVFGGVWLHAAIQLFGLCAIMAGFGLGIHLSMISDYLFTTTHTVLGTVVVCLFLVQPLLGLLHHRQYQKIGRRSYFGFSHIWYGRILIILGVINGGLGLQLAANTTHGEVAYGAVAGGMLVLYVVVMLVMGARKRKEQKREGSSS